MRCAGLRPILKLPELLVSPRRAICSSARLPQLLRARDTLYASEMSSQGVRWQLPPLALMPRSKARGCVVLEVARGHQWAGVLSFHPLGDQLERGLLVQSATQIMMAASATKRISRMIRCM